MSCTSAASRASAAVLYGARARSVVTVGGIISSSPAS